MLIRTTEESDVAGLARVLDETGLFPSEYLPGMLSGFLSAEDCDEVWLTCESDGQPVGFCYAARIRDFWAAGDDKVIFWKPLQS
ncbi:MAG: hypothetical protein ACR2QL_00110 [Woeseiaceae bacterium]